MTSEEMIKSIKDLKAAIEAQKKLRMADGKCPSCGHCNTCGRGGVAVSVDWTYLPNPPITYRYPTWYGNTVTSGSTTLSATQTLDGGASGSGAYRAPEAAE